MLEQASHYIAARARQATLVSRSPAEAANRIGAGHAALDWTNRDAALAAVESLPEADLLLSWLHDDGTWLARPLEDRLAPGGRSIRVHGSNSRDPAVRSKRDPDPRDDVRRQTVILGWVNEPGGARWLTHEEISAAVIRAIESPGDEVVVAGGLEGDQPTR
ncbi:MAG: hypothetical protein JJ913_04935 [Rhizobiaceae bacterium]|nr:hypothetical protein [Rhizobiaceae bacterium]